jgi:hypothetical protein
MAEIEVSYPKRCRDCPAFYLTSYRCHNEYGDEAHCTLGYMSGYDMRDFSGDVRFKHCKLSSSPSPNKDSDDIGMDFCGEFCEYADDLIKRKNAQILELQADLKFVRAGCERLTELAVIDAIKEFAKRIKEKRGLYGEIWESDIDNIVKEMAGDNDGKNIIG